MKYNSKKSQLVDLIGSWVKALNGHGGNCAVNMYIHQHPLRGLTDCHTRLENASNEIKYGVKCAKFFIFAFHRIMLQHFIPKLDESANLKTH
jgi:hypothetical protein